MAISQLVVLFLLGCIAPTGFCVADFSESQKPGSCEQPDGSTTADLIDSISDDFGLGWQPFVEARPALTGHHKALPELAKRECLANGTNFCFNNDVNYCSSCGTCCSGSGSKWCCSSDSICCGNACCGSGQTCSKGKCYLPVVTVTTENTYTTIATVTATALTTVLKVVVVQALTFSVSESTVTDSSGTQTDWSVVTVTSVVDKRAVPTFQREIGSDDDCDTDDELELGRPGLPTTFTPAPAPAAFRRRHFINRRRGATATTASDLASTAVTSTVTSAVTVTSVVTRNIATTTTVMTTSTELTIVYQTNTKVINAMTTISLTSTYIFASQNPVTSTSIVVATMVESSTPSTSQSTATAAPPSLVTEPSSSRSSHSGLSSASIAGISVGSAVGAILLVLLAFLSVRRHQRKKRRAIETGDPYLGGGLIQHNYTGPPPPAAAGYGRGLPSMQQQAGLGLPAVPYFSKVDGSPAQSPAQSPTTNTANTTAVNSPLREHHSSMSSTSSAGLQPSGSLAWQLSDPAAVAAVAASAAAATASAGGRNNQHLRSGSGATTGTVTSSTAVGSSGRNSLSSAWQLGNAQHHRNSSMGSGTTAQTLAHLGEDSGHGGGGPSTELPRQSLNQSAPDVASNNRETTGWRSGFRRSRTNTVTQGGGFFYRDY